MHSLKIISIKKMFSGADNAEILDVAVELFKGKKSLGVRKYGYPLSISIDAVKEELGKIVQALDTEEENKERQEVLDRAHKIADVTIDELTGAVIK